MLHFSPLKILIIVLTCLAGVITAAPNLFSKEQLATWPSWVPKNQIPLGLDLQGGVHLVLELNTDELKKTWYDNILDDVRGRLRGKVKVAFSPPGIVGDKVQVKIERLEDVDKAFAELRGMAQQIAGVGFSGIGGPDLEIRKDGQTITIQPTEAGIRQKIDTGMGTATETIRRRIDPGGTKEPNIVRQGVDRILVQVPGIADPQALKEDIGKTAKLTFQFVHPTITASEARQTQMPAGYVILPAQIKAEGEELIERRVIVNGEDLVDASQGFDSQSNQPIVNFRFNQTGARKFGKATQENVGRRFAIVLDREVISAPVIQTAILGGSGQISGRFTVDTANRLAVLLRSGALPATLTVVEERTVGPSLGADSIKAGKIASYIAFAAVSAFMMIAYGLFGFFSVMALIIKLILIFGIMSLFRFTLTLPGIAGIALTIGIAVDANVLIYERMREELRGGKSPIAAIDAGFTRAIATIIDTQLTTLIAGIILFWLGSGPIRGFGITLTIGILTAVFSAVTLTRLIISWWLRGQRASKREIVVPV